MSAKLAQNLRDIWTDLYQLHVKFDAMGNTVDDWDVFWKTAVSIIHKHNDNKLAQELALALAAYLESERKQATKEEAECRAEADPGSSGTEEQNSQATQNGSRELSQLAMF